MVSMITTIVFASQTVSNSPILLETMKGASIRRRSSALYQPRPAGDGPSTDQFVLMTLRSHDQYNTTIYGLNDRYRGVHGHRRVLFMNATDMVNRGWKTRQSVDITSHFNGETRRAENWLLVPYDIPAGNLAAYFPEANSFVPLHSTAEDSNTPTSKWIVCTLSSSDTNHGEEE